MYFNEEQHIYTHKITGEIYSSVTSIISKYKNKFKSIEISEKFVKDHSELNNDKELREYLNKLLLLNKKVEDVVRPLTPETVRNLWSESSINAQIKGKSYHFKNEIETIHNKTNLTREYNDSIFDLQKDLKDGYYPELILWSDKYKIAGMIDKVYIEGNKVWITDYKTNKNEITKGDDKYKMLYPLDYLNDSSYYHYECQLNIYGYLLELLGYKVQNLQIIHKRFLDTDVVPDNYLFMWQSPDEVKKPRILNLNYYPLRIKSFLDYDYKQRINT
jgi:ATP-dependent exoDNAse (exonuclease V) beta subunit